MLLTGKAATFIVGSVWICGNGVFGACPGPTWLPGYSCQVEHTCTCKNDEAFRDAYGYSCSDWYEDCFDDYGYQPDEQEEVINHCPLACAICSCQAQRTCFSNDSDIMFNSHHFRKLHNNDSVVLTKRPWWFTADLVTTVFKIFIEEVLGYTLEFDPPGVWWVLEGQEDFLLEVWDVVEEKSGHEAFELGYNGQQGVYFAGLRYETCIPSQPNCTDKCSESDATAGLCATRGFFDMYSGHMSAQASGYFPALGTFENTTGVQPFSESIPTHCRSLGAPTCMELYVVYSTQSVPKLVRLVEKSGFPYRVLFTSQNDFEKLLRQRSDAGLGVVFTSWEPDPFLVHFKATRIAFPFFLSYCGDGDEGFGTAIGCDKPSVQIHNFVNSSLAYKAPEIYYALKERFRILQLDLDIMMGFHQSGGGEFDSMDDAACAWMTNNTFKVQQWLPDCTSGAKPYITTDRSLKCCNGSLVTLTSESVYECVPACDNTSEVPNVFGATCLKRCPDGSVLDRAKDSCVGCPEGMVWETLSDPFFTGVVAECQCPQGRFSESAWDYKRTVGDLPIQMCQRCPAGKYQDVWGETFCLTCPTGRYQEENAASQCHRCAVGRYAKQDGMTQCESCEDLIGAASNQLQLTTQSLGSDLESDCVCKAGTYMDCATQRCITCTEGLHCPVSGLRLGNCSQNRVEYSIEKQFTPMLEIGYMSEAGSPFSVLTCVSNKTCPTTRCLPGLDNVSDAYCSLGLESVSDACFGNAHGVRCAKCADGWHMTSEYVCEPCPAGEARILKIAGVATIQFLAVLQQYAQTKIHTGNLLPTLMALLGPTIPFAQKVVAFRSLNVEWPEFLQLPDSFSFMRSFSDFWDLLEIPDSCVLPPHPAWILVRNACLPFVPLVNFMIIAAFCSMCRIRVRWNAFISIYLQLLATFFVSIALMGVTMFNRERMPNGDYYLKDIPHLKFGAEEWSQAAPIGIATCIIYCGAFIAYVGHAIVVAPSKAASDPIWVERHNFMLDNMRCECWWWIATELLFAVAIAVVQTLSDDVFVQIYFLLTCAMFLLVGVFHFKPYFNGLLNRIEVVLKFSVVCQLLCMTVLIDTENLPLDQYRQTTGKIWLSSICIGLGFAILMVAYKAKKVLISERRGYAESVRFVYQLRDLIHIISTMPEKHFFANLLHLNSVERHQLSQARNVFIGCFLQEQPGHHLWQQRVMEGIPFKVWSSTETSSRVLAAMANGEALEAFRRNEHLRRNVQILGSSIVKSVGKITNTGIANILPKVTENIQVTNHDLALSEDEFVENFRLSSGLASEDMREIFTLFDIDENRRLSMQEIVGALKTMTQDDIDINGPLPKDEHMENNFSEELEAETKPFHLSTLEQSETEAKPVKDVSESNQVLPQRCRSKFSL